MKEMKPRDRFIGALRHEKIDRVPRLFRFKREAKEKVARVFGITETETGLGHQPGILFSRFPRRAI